MDIRRSSTSCTLKMINTVLERLQLYQHHIYPVDFNFGRNWFECCIFLSDGSQICHQRMSKNSPIGRKSRPVGRSARLFRLILSPSLFNGFRPIKEILIQKQNAIGIYCVSGILGGAMAFAIWQDILLK